LWYIIIREAQNERNSFIFHVDYLRSGILGAGKLDKKLLEKQQA
jgi:hypothetical protein